MEEPASAVFTAVSASVRIDASDNMMKLSIAQMSGQIHKKQSSEAAKLSKELKRQASDILESKSGNGDVKQLKEIFQGK